MAGNICRALPLRYARRAVTATVTRPPLGRFDSSGQKRAASTALGITDTRCGGTAERSTVFSLAVWLTQMTWLVSARQQGH